ncbi:MAG: hypothetical protein ABWU13_13580 [Limnospira maxima]|uniref:hypothetical protein n=1 Tax=Limnospira sp. Paracas R14 TaxID=2981108 RepID=UPI0028E16082|nr:hypothetical protein [Limnospira sp. Paracas R14]
MDISKVSMLTGLLIAQVISPVTELKAIAQLPLIEFPGEAERMQGSLLDLGCDVPLEAAGRIAATVRATRHQYFNTHPGQEFPPGSLTIYCPRTGGFGRHNPPPGETILIEGEVRVIKH